MLEFGKMSSSPGYHCLSQYNLHIMWCHFEALNKILIWHTFRTPTIRCTISHLPVFQLMALKKFQPCDDLESVLLHLPKCGHRQIRLSSSLPTLCLWECLFRCARKPLLVYPFFCLPPQHHRDLKFVEYFTISPLLSFIFHVHKF